jgi:DNA-binding NarL/FixJ family response regulator
MQSELTLEYRCVPWAKIHSLIEDKSHWRRRKIIDLASKGFTQAQIARKIGWSYSTVKREIYEIRKTCQVKEKNSCSI